MSKKEANLDIETETKTKTEKEKEANLDIETETETEANSLGEEVKAVTFVSITISWKIQKI
jgi:hypothetical protein